MACHAYVHQLERLRKDQASDQVDTDLENDDKIYQKYEQYKDCAILCKKYQSNYNYKIRHSKNTLSQF